MPRKICVFHVSDDSLEHTPGGAAIFIDKRRQALMVENDDLRECIAGTQGEDQAAPTCTRRSSYLMRALWERGFGKFNRLLQGIVDAHGFSNLRIGIRESFDRAREIPAPISPDLPSSLAAGAENLMPLSV